MSSNISFAALLQHHGTYHKWNGLLTLYDDTKNNSNTNNNNNDDDVITVIHNTTNMKNGHRYVNSQSTENDARKQNFQCPVNSAVSHRG